MCGQVAPVIDASLKTNHDMFEYNGFFIGRNSASICERYPYWIQTTGTFERDFLCNDLELRDGAMNNANNAGEPESAYYASIELAKAQVDAYNKNHRKFNDGDINPTFNFLKYYKGFWIGDMWGRSGQWDVAKDVNGPYLNLDGNIGEWQGKYFSSEQEAKLAVRLYNKRNR